MDITNLMKTAIDAGVSLRLGEPPRSPKKSRDLEALGIQTVVYGETATEPGDLFSANLQPTR